MLSVLGTLAILSSLAPSQAVHGETVVGTIVERQGDEMMVCGQLVHTTTPVVLWTDPGGYDAYRVERRFSKFEDASWDKSQQQVRYLTSPNRFGLRQELLTPDQIEQVRGGGWDLPLLQEVVDQFVIHYDVCGTSQRCFQVLHDARGLSVHFLLDIDGTIYQTLDLKERAWHATTSNSRSVGIEIAQIGAYPPEQRQVLDDWYGRDEGGQVRLTVPGNLAALSLRTADFVGRPARSQLITGTIQGTELCQYDFTPQQYQALIKLTAALCKVLPRIRCDYPRDAEGELIPHKLPDNQLAAFQGVLGHYHIQKNKTDPGPAFQWDLVIDGARKMLDGQ